MTTGPNTGLVAALLTRMSIPPNSATQCATPASTASGLLADPAWAVACPPAARSVVTVSSSSSCFRAVTHTAAPADTSDSAIARPIPRVPPVIRATFPSTRRIVLGSIMRRV